MNNKQRAFTLIEVLAVITIIGILSAIVTPAVGGALAKARKMRTASNLRQIAISYGAHVNGGGSTKNLNGAATVADWAAALAADGGGDDASIYIVSEDYLVTSSSRPTPKRVLARGNATASEEFRSFPLAIAVITGLSPDDDPTTTPLAYSRGLDENSGYWRAQNGDGGGVYGQTGGFVVFLDGHVNWYGSIAEDGGALVDFETGAKTASVRSAVRSGARAIDWKGTVWSKN
ncbi:MAG: type II secretion system GspH family protein [Puniceicoccales bacterium]|jgi:prepilin-type N-terminal cleavage/methylation domain-containing protein|nr:type II secretion system GspH family protein [Puniceicoccales bacterium]